MGTSQSMRMPSRISELNSALMAPPRSFRGGPIVNAPWFEMRASARKRACKLCRGGGRLGLEPLTIGYIGCAAFAALIFLRTPIAYAMAIVGVLGLLAVYDV